MINTRRLLEEHKAAYIQASLDLENAFHSNDPRQIEAKADNLRAILFQLSLVAAKTKPLG